METPTRLPCDVAELSRASGIRREELAMLDDAGLQTLSRNLRIGNAINRCFRRSQWYPFPRDLCFPEERSVLRKWARGRRRLVEIGVFEAVSSALFRSVMTSTGTLHLIDPYVVVPDSGLTARPWMAYLKMMCRRHGTVIWHRDYSHNVVREWRRPIDFLFIDGDHSYLACRQDWDLWRPFVEPGGVVLFHDARFGLGHTGSWDGWPGPSMVVNESFRGPKRVAGWSIVDEVGSLIVVQRTT